MTGKFEFIDAEYAAYRESDDEYVPSLVKMCIWMEVSWSGFYEWRNAPESATAKRRGILALYVKKSFWDSEDSFRAQDHGPRAGPGALNMDANADRDSGASAMYRGSSTAASFG